MRLPVTWLKEFVPFRQSIDELARRLTFGGFEVESVLDVEGDKVFEINVTPNRGDCLSVYGMARETGALLGIPLKKQKSEKLKTQKKKSPISVVVKAPKKCPRYAMAVIAGVKIGASPDWLRRKLTQVGIRPVNNVVDVTNYVLMEMGQPLHAFDYSKIAGEDGNKKIIVRTAQEGEKLLTLDGEEYSLNTDDLVIADSSAPIALAGVMGGEGSEIDGASTTVALESAFFEPAGIRRTSRRLGARSESSYRFERRVDPEAVLPALIRAALMIQSVAGGEIVGEPVVVRRDEAAPRRISFDPSLVEARLGGHWTTAAIKKSFARLNFPVREKGKGWEVTVPSYRGDLSCDADLVEEVARLEGLERIPTTFPALTAATPAADSSYALERQGRRLLSDLGFNETIHFSFCSPEEIKHFDPSLMDKAVVLENPLGQEYSVMRPTLLTSLLKTIAFHHRHKISSVRLFELRNVFSKNGEAVEERKTVSGVLSGQKILSHWSDQNHQTDFFDLKGVVERFGDFDFAKGDAVFLHPGKQAAVKKDGKRIGVIGEIHPDLQSHFDLKQPVYLFELDAKLFFEVGEKKKNFEDYSRYPIVERDLALLVDEATPAGPILDFIGKQDPAIWQVSLFDLYRGAQVPAGKKSLAFSIHVGNRERTLTDEEVNGIYGKLVEGVKKSFGAEIR